MKLFLRNISAEMAQKNTLYSLCPIHFNQRLVNLYPLITKLCCILTVTALKQRIKFFHEHQSCERGSEEIQDISRPSP